MATLNTTFQDYRSSKDMKRGMDQMQRKGWAVLSTQEIEDPGNQKRKAWGCLFLGIPGLLMANRKVQRVVYQRSVV